MRRWILILIIFFPGIQNNAQTSSEKNFGTENLFDFHQVNCFLFNNQPEGIKLNADNPDCDCNYSPAELNINTSYSVSEGQKEYLNQNIGCSFLSLLVPALVDLPPPSDLRYSLFYSDSGNHTTGYSILAFKL